MLIEQRWMFIATLVSLGEVSSKPKRFNVDFPSNKFINFG